MPLAARLSRRTSGIGIVDSSQSAAHGTNGNLLLCRTSTSWVIYGCATPSWEPRCTSTLTHTLTGFFFLLPQSLPILVCEWNIANHCPSLSHSCVVSFFPPDLLLNISTSIVQVQQQPAILPVATSPLLSSPLLSSTTILTVLQNALKKYSYRRPYGARHSGAEAPFAPSRHASLHDADRSHLRRFRHQGSPDG
jgi:hypothetical protein